MQRTCNGKMESKFARIIKSAERGLAYGKPDPLENMLVKQKCGQTFGN